MTDSAFCVRNAFGVLVVAALVLATADACTSSAPASPHTATATGSTSSSASPSSSPAQMTLTSSAFVNGGYIPKTYTCDATGAAVSPPLAWSGVPAGTGWLALYAYDNTGSVIHWIVVDLKPTVTALPTGTTGGGVVVANYLPMCPGSGNTDVYQFTLYAEPAAYHLPKIGGQYAVDPGALTAHALGIGTLTATYSE